MTPIPTSYLTRDLYRRTWEEAPPTSEPDAGTCDGERPSWEDRLRPARRALAALLATQPHPRPLEADRS